MRASSSVIVVLINAAFLSVGCSQPTSPTSPSSVRSSGAAFTSSPLAVSAAAQPPFNLQAILRGEGFGLVKLRQEKDPTQNILYADVWVRDLLPNTSYDLQRAVDGPADGVCTGADWLTLGQIITNDTGTGRAALSRAVPAIPVPLDIHFRVIQTGTSDVTLQSDCYRLVVRD